MRTDFIKVKDPAVLSYISQIEQNNYTDLNETMIEMVRKALLEGPKPQNLGEVITDHEHQRIDEVLSSAFQEIRLVEKIYWA